MRQSQFSDLEGSVAKKSRSKETKSGMALKGSATVVPSVLTDDYVPKDYTDLQRHYGPFVARLVTKYNKISSSYEDLLQTIWLKLIEVDIIVKYNIKAAEVPEVMSRAQAANHLGMTLGDFTKALEGRTWWHSSIGFMAGVNRLLTLHPNISRRFQWDRHSRI